MSKTPFLIATIFALCATTVFVDHAEARERSRAVQRTGQGGSVAVDRSNARFDSQRQRAWQADGQGNASAWRNGSIAGTNGGSASVDRGAYRNADGSAGRQGSAYVNGPHGGTASTSGGISRDADGNVSGARSTTATGANGNGYTGSTTVSGGTVTHTGTCTNASGETIACTRGH
ncbi:hypothetical protein [Pseudoxanthomonas japonensis]|uniref:Uncharacterized protein n=1 Tax=Pseudoxanthomonas japonensis TaxID=69284 RepID=A0ABQ6ZM75_9GAMM|nr:hypothetical protein [Pseudoxanthomonas japonensis]KAF1727450.1 hypothetical protein CSC78_01140 [Pseudoxanthomonas japonensis]